MNKFRSKLISDNEIYKALNGQTKILTYPELSNYDSLEELLYPYNNVVILYETKGNFGHWVCLFKYHYSSTISFFDSYGLKPDEELKITNDVMKTNTYPYLSWLLLHHKGKVEYNHYQFQKYLQDVNTCGRWVIVRLLYMDVPLKKFINMFKTKNDGIDTDDFVTFLTINL